MAVAFDGAHCALMSFEASEASFHWIAKGRMAIHFHDEEEKDHLIVFSLRFDCVFI